MRFGAKGVGTENKPGWRWNSRACDFGKLLLDVIVFSIL